MNRWNLCCLSHLSDSLSQVQKVVSITYERKYFLFTPTVYLFGAEKSIVEMRQDEQVKFMILVTSQRQLISGPKRCFNYLWKKILFVYSNCLSYWSLDVTKWTGEIFVACPISATAYLRFNKIFQLLMKENTFCLLQLSIFLELRYALLRCDKRRNIEL